METREIEVETTFIYIYFHCIEQTFSDSIWQMFDKRNSVLPPNCLWTSYFEWFFSRPNDDNKQWKWQYYNYYWFQYQALHWTDICEAI